MMAATMDQPQTRVMIWAVPRCISSAMLRAMINKTRTKGLNEPFSDAYYFGSERTSSRYSEQEPTENRRYQDIKDRLEQPYTGFQTVVSKDLAYCLGHEKADMIPRLPAGYVHTFIMRHPAKSLPSLYKVALSADLTGWDHFEPKEAGFKELLALHELVTQQLGQKAVVVDMDDLLQQPEAMLKLYCEEVGLAYEDAMLHWDTEKEDLSVFGEWPAGWYGILYKSNTFQKPVQGKNRQEEAPDLPDMVQKAIEESLPYYNDLYEKRLKL